HRGAAFVEIYQNCNVFNDGAFEKVTGRDVRADSLIPLVHGQPIRFGSDGQLGVVLEPDGHLRVREVADVGQEALLVHDESREDPGLAFQLSRLARGPFEPTPIGVFRAVGRTEYGEAMGRQLLEAHERKGAGDLPGLLRSGGTWTVEEVGPKVSNGSKGSNGS
ncbi:MAG: 2-oxoacid:ferredoxin oxidoreductase subunit beta, partial [Acidimicrobiales bacterium]